MWISIEGNIGSGKTTAQDTLEANQKEWIFAKEPVHEWVRPVDSLDKKSMLQVFQEDPEKNGSFFQAQALSTRLAILNPLMPLAKSKVLISERSPESDFEIFAPLMKMTAFERACYESIFFCLNEKVPDLVIYIQTDPATCLNRIASRGRSSEQNISLEYLERVHQEHEDQMIKLKKSKRPQVIIRGNLSKQDVQEQILTAIRKHLLQNGVLP